MGNDASREQAPTYNKLKAEFAKNLAAIGHARSAAQELPRTDVLENFEAIDESFLPYDVAFVHTGAQKRSEVATMVYLFQQKGCRCFFDFNMEPGSLLSPTEYMRLAFRTARHVVVVLSKEFLDKVHPCSELLYSCERSAWILDHFRWKSVWVVCYNLSIDDYDDSYNTNLTLSHMGKRLPPLGRILTVYDYTSGWYGMWTELCHAVKADIVAHDRNRNAIFKWTEFLRAHDRTTGNPPPPRFPMPDYLYARTDDGDEETPTQPTGGGDEPYDGPSGQGGQPTGGGGDGPDNGPSGQGGQPTGGGGGGGDGDGDGGGGDGDGGGDGPDNGPSGQGGDAPPIDVRNAYDVFICHTRQQKRDYAATMRFLFNQAGLRCFMDLDMTPGASPVTQMQFVQSTCRYTVVLLSKEFLKRSQTVAELNYAFRRMKWLRAHNAWNSLLVVLLDMSVSDYKEVYLREPNKFPNLLEIVLMEYSRLKLGWPQACQQIINAIESFDKEDGALEAWKRFLKDYGTFEDFPRSTDLYSR